MVLVSFLLFFPLGVGSFSAIKIGDDKMISVIKFVV